jgi:toxin ParE1/3/4
MLLVLRTRQANFDLVEIGFRIAEENPAAADRWLDLIETKCRLLAQAPELGRRREDLAPDLRGFPVGNFVIFYRPIADGIQVIRVLHGARDLPAIFD